MQIVFCFWPSNLSRRSRRRNDSEWLLVPLQVCIFDNRHFSWDFWCFVLFCFIFCFRFGSTANQNGSVFSLIYVSFYMIEWFSVQLLDWCKSLRSQWPSSSCSKSVVITVISSNTLRLLIFIMLCRHCKRMVRWARICSLLRRSNLIANMDAIECRWGRLRVLTSYFVCVCVCDVYLCSLCFECVHSWAVEVD